jgi:hypothetical protein
LVCSYREFVRWREGPVGLPVDASDSALIYPKTRSVAFGRKEEKRKKKQKNLKRHMWGVFHTSCIGFSCLHIV